ncbi:hypothetical protein BH23ACT5_BH23ACT5_15890 [soil metagenome]
MAGMGSGLLSLAVVYLLGVFVLSSSGADAELAVGLATTFGTIAGFVVAGAVAGHQAVVRAPFHGAVAAMLVAGVVIVVALLGGSPSPTLQVLLLATFAIALGGASGWLSRRRPSTTDESQVGGDR